MVRSEHPLTSQSLRPEGNTALERFLPCNCLFFWFYLSTSTKFHSNSFFPLWSVVAQCLVLQVKLFCLSLPQGELLRGSLHWWYFGFSAELLSPGAGFPLPIQTHQRCPRVSLPGCDPGQTKLLCLFSLPGRSHRESEEHKNATSELERCSPPLF